MSAAIRPHPYLGNRLCAQGGLGEGLSKKRSSPLMFDYGFQFLMIVKQIFSCSSANRVLAFRTVKMKVNYGTLLASFFYVNNTLVRHPSSKWYTIRSSLIKPRDTGTVG